MEEIQIIGGSIKEKLENTKSAIHVIGKAWEYTWVNGFRIVASEMLDLKPGDKVLDVGCGDGWFSIQNALKHPDVEFLGVDLFEAQEAEEISKLIGVENCKFYEMDTLNMNIREKVDHVILFMALGNICENSSDIEKLFRKC